MGLIGALMIYIVNLNKRTLKIAEMMKVTMESSNSSEDDRVISIDSDRLSLKKGRSHEKLDHL